MNWLFSNFLFLLLVTRNNFHRAISFGQENYVSLRQINRILSNFIWLNGGGCKIPLLWCLLWSCNNKNAGDKGGKQVQHVNDKNWQGREADHKLPSYSCLVAWGSFGKYVCSNFPICNPLPPLLRHCSFWFTHRTHIPYPAFAHTPRPLKEFLMNGK